MPLETTCLGRGSLSEDDEVFSRSHPTLEGPLRPPHLLLPPPSHSAKKNTSSSSSDSYHGEIQSCPSTPLRNEPISMARMRSCSPALEGRTEDWASATSQDNSPLHGSFSYHDPAVSRGQRIRRSFRKKLDFIRLSFKTRSESKLQDSGLLRSPSAEPPDLLGTDQSQSCPTTPVQGSLDPWLTIPPPSPRPLSPGFGWLKKRKDKKKAPVRPRLSPTRSRVYMPWPPVKQDTECVCRKEQSAQVANFAVKNPGNRSPGFVPYLQSDLGNEGTKSGHASPAHSRSTTRDKKSSTSCHSCHTCGICTPKQEVNLGGQ